MRALVLGSVALLALLSHPVAAQEYAIDAAHSAAIFKISHIGLSWTYGRFNEVTGGFKIDAANPAASSFTFLAKADSVDTGNTKRDDHLRSPDFFNTKQFPAISFQSTQVQPIQGGYQVTGNLTLHGVTKPVVLELAGGRQAEFPAGVHRTGYSTELTIKRSDFGMDKMLEAIGDNVFITLSFEGTRK